MAGWGHSYDRKRLDVDSGRRNFELWRTGADTGLLIYLTVASREAGSLDVCVPMQCEIAARERLRAR